MAIFKAKFEDIDFEQVEGFRISVAFTPTAGFEGNFFIYLWDSVDAHKQFDDSIKIPEGSPQVGELTLSDGADVTYKFPDIDLNYIEAGATRSQRYRLVEFRYPQHRSDRENLASISIKNSLRKKLTKGRLGDDYDFKLDDSPEPLLGFRVRLTPGKSNVVRFSSLRNESNSFLEKLLDVNKGQTAERMPSFEVGFKQAKFDVNRENLLVAFVDESYGYFSAVPLPPISRIVELGEGGRQELAQLRPEEFTSAQLIEQDIQEMRQRSVSSDVIETATLLFQSGEYRDIEVK